jgi:hypothetical protein
MDSELLIGAAVTWRMGSSPVEARMVNERSMVNINLKANDFNTDVLDVAPFHLE